MKWRASTLRKAAELQAQIEQLQRVLAELLQATEVTVTAPKRVDGRASKVSSQNGSLRSETVSAPQTKGVAADVLEILDEVLFWGSEFSRWEGLKPIDRDRFISAECDLTEEVSK
jgi:hypothetical protein